MCMLETLAEDAEREHVHEVIKDMLDDLSVRDLKDLIRAFVPTERLYAEASERGYADP